MRRSTATFTTLALLPLLGGCAGYRLTPVSPTEVTKTWGDCDPPAGQVGKQPQPDKQTTVGPEGYLFYEPAPFLLGTLRASTKADTEKQGEQKPAVTTAEYDFQIVYLPNYDRPYRFTRYEVLAKSDLKITFSNGWMFTGAESSTDSTAALSSLVELAKAGLSALATGSQPPEPVLLYRIDIRNRSAALVKVPFSPPAP